jgi:hypothetical protein
MLVAGLRPVGDRFLAVLVNCNDGRRQAMRSRICRSYIHHWAYKLVDQLVGTPNHQS